MPSSIKIHAGITLPSPSLGFEAAPTTENDQAIALPEPATDGGTSLEEEIDARRSVRV